MATLKKVLLVAGKFISGGLIVMAFMVLLKNRQDFLMIGLSLIISFFLGGILMFLSLFKDLKMLVTSNKSLKRKLIRMEKQLSEYENENDHLSDAVEPGKLIDIIEKSA